jgi:hypothetical protein
MRSEHEPASVIAEATREAASRMKSRNTQRLVRSDANGSRHDFVRIPVVLLDGEASDGDDLDG